jgi:hypothetical protein
VSGSAAAETPSIPAVSPSTVDLFFGSSLLHDSLLTDLLKF